MTSPTRDPGKMVQPGEAEAVAWQDVTDEDGLNRQDVPKGVPLIVSWKEHPYKHLYLKTTVAWCSDFDGSWSDYTGETISQPTHWQAYMSLEEAIELGKSDSEANWDTPVRMEAYRVRNALRLDASALSAAYARGVEDSAKVAASAVDAPEDGEYYIVVKIEAAIRALLPEGDVPADDSEAVAMMLGPWDKEGDCVSWLEGCEKLTAGDYLYAAPPQPSDDGWNAALFAWLIVDPSQNEEAWEVRFERLTEEEKRDGLAAFPLRLAPADEAKLPAPPTGGN